MEYILSGIILLEAIYIAYLEYQFKKERADLLKAIMAKNLQEYTSASIINTNKPPMAEREPDLIPIEQVSDKVFTQVIKNK